jgi:hypothetical protein
MKVLAISNNFQVNKSLQTKVVKFRHSADAYGFEYSLNPNFYQQFRVELVFGRIPKFPTIEKEYRQQDGYFRSQNVSIDKVETLKTGYLDRTAHVGLAVALKHNEMYIDGVNYFCRGEYQLDGDDDDTLTNLVQAKAEILEQRFNISSVTC